MEIQSHLRKVILETVHTWLDKIAILVISFTILNSLNISIVLQTTHINASWHEDELHVIIIKTEILLPLCRASKRNLTTRNKTVLCAPAETAMELRIRGHINPLFNFHICFIIFAVNILYTKE